MRRPRSVCRAVRQSPASTFVVWQYPAFCFVESDHAASTSKYRNRRLPVFVRRPRSLPFARTVFARHQSQIHPHLFRRLKSLDLINDRCETRCRDHSDSRNRLSSLDGFIVRCQSFQFLVSNLNLLVQRLHRGN